MPRLMSVALTEQAVVERRKTVTRRLGWLHAEVGMQLTLCRKVMGRKKGDPLVRLGEAHVTAVYRQKLWDVTDRDVRREGVPAEMFDEVDAHGVPTPGAWVTWFCEEQNCLPHHEVTVIEFYRVPPAEMLPGADGDGEGLCEKWCMAQCQGLCGANR